MHERQNQCPAMERMFSGRSTIVATKELVSCNVAEEAVVLNLKVGAYYSLNSVGARIWNLIQAPRTMHEIRDAIVHEYNVDPDRCERDLQVLLRDLTAQGLVEVQDETTPRITRRGRASSAPVSPRDAEQDSAIESWSRRETPRGPSGCAREYCLDA